MSLHRHSLLLIDSSKMILTPNTVLNNLILYAIHLIRPIYIQALTSPWLSKLPHTIVLDTASIRASSRLPMLEGTWSWTSIRVPTTTLRWLIFLRVRIVH